jgi:hypothetical protein
VSDQDVAGASRRLDFGEVGQCDEEVVTLGLQQFSIGDCSV